MRLAFGKPSGTSLLRVGSEYGGWHIPPVDPTWVCCTAGVGEDSTFDVALAERGCSVVAVDPTPRAIAHIQPLLKFHPTLQFAPYAVWDERTELEFFPPADAAHVSFSATNLQGTRKPIIVKARPLDELMQAFGYAQMQLVKLDIEGAEYRVLQSLDLDALGIEVLCVEFHFGDRGLPRMIRAIRQIEKRGFRVAHIVHTDVTFLRR